MAIIEELREQFGEAVGVEQSTCDGMPTVWVAATEDAPVLRKEVLRILAAEYPDFRRHDKGIP